MGRRGRRVWSPGLLFAAAAAAPNNLPAGAAKHFLIMLKQTFCGSIFGLAAAKCIDGLWKWLERRPKSASPPSLPPSDRHTHTLAALTAPHVIYKFGNYR